MSVIMGTFVAGLFLLVSGLIGLTLLKLVYKDFSDELDDDKQFWF